MSSTSTGDFEGEDWEAAVMAIMLLILPGQLPSPPNEITKNTNQSVMTDRLEEKKIIIQGHVRPVDMLYNMHKHPLRRFGR